MYCNLRESNASLIFAIYSTGECGILHACCSLQVFQKPAGNAVVCTRLCTRVVVCKLILNVSVATQTRREEKYRYQLDDVPAEDLRVFLRHITYPSCVCEKVTEASDRLRDRAVPSPFFPRGQSPTSFTVCMSPPHPPLSVVSAIVLSVR